MNREEYNKIDALNWSLLKHILSCPAEFARHRGLQLKPTPAMSLGSALHCRVFEGRAEYDKQFAMPPIVDRRTKAGKAEYAEWLEGVEGREVLTRAQVDDAAGMEHALRKDPHTKDLLWESGGKNEQLLNGYVDGIPVKGIADRIVDDFSSGGSLLIDLKTTSRGLMPEELDRTVARFGYHSQMALYAHMMPEPPTEVILVFIQTTPPYFPAVWRMNQPTLSYGMEIVERAIAIYRECEASGLWPGYTSMSQEPRGLPPWAMPEEGLPTPPPQDGTMAIPTKSSCFEGST